MRSERWECKRTEKDWWGFFIMKRSSGYEQHLAQLNYHFQLIIMDKMQMMELNRNYLPMYDWLDLLLVLCMHSFVINEKEKKKRKSFSFI